MAEAYINGTDQYSFANGTLCWNFNFDYGLKPTTEVPTKQGYQANLTCATRGFKKNVWQAPSGAHIGNWEGITWKWGS